uniref:Uncharacterized protein n=1 Tax=Takifugu rubripes TaxID=31033 RepID=A0A3B5KVS2_TAKRU
MYRLSSHVSISHTRVQTFTLAECQPDKSFYTHPFRLFIWEDAALSTCCEVAVNLEGVPGAALIWINPVLAWKNRRGGAIREHHKGSEGYVSQSECAERIFCFRVCFFASR